MQITNHRFHLLSVVTLALSMPLLAGAKGDGCAANSRSAAPDTSGEWALTYDDVIDVEITIGGAVYTEQLGVQGGAFTITHNGQPLSFDLDCTRPEIVCPSEAWPEQVTIEQRNLNFEHRMIVTLPTQQCDGQLVEPLAGECGADTNNPDCEMVCDGTISVVESERFGVIGETGDSFRLYLGAGVATNGFNCALLAVSLADADLVNEGSEATGDWRSTAMDAGLVTVGYAGGCLWAGDPNMDGQLEALLISASIKFTTGFTGLRL
jgi:hypothetical protein